MTISWVAGDRQHHSSSHSPQLPADQTPAKPGLVLSDFAGHILSLGAKPSILIACWWCPLERPTKTSSRRGCSTTKERGAADPTLSVPSAGARARWAICKEPGRQIQRHRVSSHSRRMGKGPKGTGQMPPGSHLGSASTSRGALGQLPDPRGSVCPHPHDGNKKAYFSELDHILLQGGTWGALSREGSAARVGAGINLGPRLLTCLFESRSPTVTLWPGHGPHAPLLVRESWAPAHSMTQGQPLCRGTRVKGPPLVSPRQ